MARHLFLVAHHEPGLHEYLLEALQGDSNVEVILDRRRDQRRRRPSAPSRSAAAWTGADVAKSTSSSWFAPT